MFLSSRKESLEQAAGGEEKAAKLLCILTAANANAGGGYHNVDCLFNAGQFVIYDRSGNNFTADQGAKMRVALQELGVPPRAITNMSAEHKTQVSFSLDFSAIDIDLVYEKTKPALEKLAKEVATSPEVINFGIRQKLMQGIVIDHEGHAANLETAQRQIASARAAIDELAEELGLATPATARKPAALSAVLVRNPKGSGTHDRF